MNKLMLLTTACLLTAGAYAATPATRLDDAVTEAKAQAAKLAYGDAAGTIGKLNGDLDVTAETGWPDALYLRAQYLARQGQTDAALALVEQAVRGGAGIKSDGLAKDDDFAALRDAPRFKAAIAALQTRERLWADESITGRRGGRGASRSAGSGPAARHSSSPIRRCIMRSR